MASTFVVLPRRGAAPRALALALLVGLLGVTASCAHRGTPVPQGPGMRFQAAATRLANIRFEDEFVEARLVLQALPSSSPERVPLRSRIVRYLLQPVERLDADKLRQEA